MTATVAPPAPAFRKWADSARPTNTAPETAAQEAAGALARTGLDARATKNKVRVTNGWASSVAITYKADGGRLKERYSEHFALTTEWVGAIGLLLAFGLAVAGGPAAGIGRLLVAILLIVYIAGYFSGGKKRAALRDQTAATLQAR